MWRKFLSSIFYVGKGKSSRPYSHLYDAMKYYEINRTHYQNKLTEQITTDVTITQERVLFHAEKSVQTTSNSTPSNVKSKSPSKKSPVKNLNLQMIKKDAQESKKLEKILEIWNSKKGVVCLHVFHNIIPAEAYTREAAIIESLTLSHLTNMKRGDYYGMAQSWNLRKRKQLGIGLLHRAMQIFLAEGESQLTPNDLA